MKRLFTIAVFMQLAVSAAPLQAPLERMQPTASVDPNPVQPELEPRPEARPTPNASIGEGSAKEAAARRLLQLMGSADLSGQMIETILPQIRSAIAGAVPQNEREKFAEDFARKFRSQVSGEEIVNAVVPIYVQHFSLDELKSLTQFYESPAGKRFVAELPEITRESQSIGAEIGQKALLETLREMASDYPDLKKLLQNENLAPSGAPGVAHVPAQGVNPK